MEGPEARKKALRQIVLQVGGSKEEHFTSGVAIWSHEQSDWALDMMFNKLHFTQTSLSLPNASRSRRRRGQGKRAHVSPNQSVAVSAFPCARD